MIVDQHHDGGGDAIVHMLGAFRATPVGDLDAHRLIGGEPLLR